ncbi:hypothetical protein [Prevotella sp. OH937_COT-195]|uniref:hypothetical protein n=1 Tax=Prevotella sp. OH937_COT-195 TaxID=2491051 RepID=UPI000F652294|nr:hypothetical protein [Prevotella sp. OH937_COT-195]RRD03001.1 hypothetical protein EII32_00665 [Prevotella sp. OH937_COT-195]
MKKIFKKIKTMLASLSFRTGVIVLVMCIPCYVISFAQAALDTSVETKAVLWTVFFGLAKIFQYGGLTILGAEGAKRVKRYLKCKCYSGLR